eukprot:CAMPEP_0118955744 /NCGR_PEP_ID=MMETSP1169-20130426/60440_1 /TAXON_ID=36882 /ORGANISM="Pyramimonas obovata, Strain CCMP722" /LENGTH=238 /DNA_ID=CAMNT_0006903647 /DNA_START=153 /DNA_END=865 /DNA_ORIENTATION=-
MAGRRASGRAMMPPPHPSPVDSSSFPSSSGRRMGDSSFRDSQTEEVGASSSRRHFPEDANPNTARGRPILSGRRASKPMVPRGDLPESSTPTSFSSRLSSYGADEVAGGSTFAAGAVNHTAAHNQFADRNYYNSPDKPRAPRTGPPRPVQPSRRRNTLGPPANASVWDSVALRDESGYNPLLLTRGRASSHVAQKTNAAVEPLVISTADKRISQDRGGLDARENKPEFRQPGPSASHT